MRLTDVIQEDQNVGFKYKWKEQPEYKGKAPSATRDRTRAALGSRETPPEAQGQPLKFSPSPEHRGARPGDRRERPPEDDKGGMSAGTPEPDQQETPKAGFTGEQGKLGQQILNFATKSKPPEFERLMKIVQQEAQRRGSSKPAKPGMQLVPKEQQGA